MSLPKRPERSQPIPNQPFDSPEVSTIKGPYWDMPLGSGLEDDGQGSVQTSGSEPSAPTAYLYGSNGFVGLGTGLQLGPNGDLEQGGGYIYCTPAYPELPVTYPPYGCNTEVNTEGVTDFTEAWYNCQELTEFNCVNSLAVTDFSYAWGYCYGLTSFPTINTSSGENFTYSWAYSGLTSFPILNLENGSNFYAAWCGCSYLETFPPIDFSNGENFRLSWYECDNLVEFPTINVSKGTNFQSSWAGCRSLTSFPTLDVSSGEQFVNTWAECNNLLSFPFLNVGQGLDFGNAWRECISLSTFPSLNVSSGMTFFHAWLGCSSLTTFPAGMFDNCSATDFTNAWFNCALSQQSVDNILVSINTTGTSNGSLGINGGTSSAPGPAGLAAKAALQARGWTVLTN